MIRYKINGKYVTQEEWDARKGVGLSGGVPMGTVAYSESKPLISEGLGCHRSSVGDLRETIKKENIMGVRVLDSGQVAITSRRGRKELMRVLSEIRGHRLVDADGGYSD